MLTSKEQKRAAEEISNSSNTIGKGTFLPGTISEFVARSYASHLYGDATLQDLPDDPPRFVINATNVQSGALWRFSKPYMRDYLVGKVSNPTVRLADAVAASSAFPPFLSPARLPKAKLDFDAPTDGEPLHRSPFTTDVFLSDGGVYDNLGLETIWKNYETLLVSDAGQKTAAEEEPDSDWPRHAKRILDIVDNQVRSLRKRQLIGAYEAGLRKGAYWGIRTNIEDYGVAGLPCPFERTQALAAIPTRLADIDDLTFVFEHLANFGGVGLRAAATQRLDDARAHARRRITDRCSERSVHAFAGRRSDESVGRMRTDEVILGIGPNHPPLPPTFGNERCDNPDRLEGWVRARGVENAKGLELHALLVADIDMNQTGCIFKAFTLDGVVVGP